jgi:IS30 family transposase
VDQYVLANKHAGGTLYRHLRCQKKRHKRYGSYDRRGKLPNRVSIEERPAIVDERHMICDWEVDTITVHEVLFITNCLNHRPRKCLDFRTPFEVFFDHSAALAS